MESVIAVLLPTKSAHTLVIGPQDLSLSLRTPTTSLAMDGSVLRHTLHWPQRFRFSSLIRLKDCIMVPTAWRLVALIESAVFRFTHISSSQTFFGVQAKLHQSKL